jgi:predicted nucleic acid-binding Zn ribbon protein
VARLLANATRKHNQLSRQVERFENPSMREGEMMIKNHCIVCNQHIAYLAFERNTLAEINIEPVGWIKEYPVCSDRCTEKWNGYSYILKKRILHVYDEMLALRARVDRENFFPSRRKYRR